MHRVKNNLLRFRAHSNEHRRRPEDRSIGPNCLTITKPMKANVNPTSELSNQGVKKLVKAEQAQHPLKGLFFRRIEAGQCFWEGQVLKIVNDQFLLVQRY